LSKTPKKAVGYFKDFEKHAFRTRKNPDTLRNPELNRNRQFQRRIPLEQRYSGILNSRLLGLMTTKGGGRYIVPTPSGGKGVENSDPLSPGGH